MKLEKKLITAIITEIVVLLILPLIFVNLAKPHDAMGLMMILFFAVNPISSVAISSLVGKDVKKLWWIPILFAFVFLFSYWLVLKEIVLDLTIYAIIYTLIGYVAMAVSWIVTRK